MKDVHQVLVGAYNALDQRGLTKGRLRGLDGVCINGALLVGACGVPYWEQMEMNGAYPVFAAAGRVVDEVLRERGVQILRHEWNNRRLRTKRQVLRVLAAAIERTAPMPDLPEVVEEAPCLSR